MRSLIRWLLDLLFGETECCLDRRVEETKKRAAARHARGAAGPGELVE